MTAEVVQPAVPEPVPYPVLVVGSGAREHALVWALAQSSSVSQVWAAPGNPGIAALAQTVDFPVTEVQAIADWAAEQQMGLVVVGPELPLSLGLADLLRERGVTVFGPTRAAAELEWSKSFAKGFMSRHGIPTAAYGVFDDAAEALAFARELSLPLVVKADGLAAGKGVLICQTLAEVEAAINAVLVERAFGEAGGRVVIEAFLEGQELSVIALVDGERCAVLPLARDYKRLADGDDGPNTGGMGSYAPVLDLPDGMQDEIRSAILEPTIAGMRAEGRVYQGALYTGLMLTADGPKVLEYNCRFGDPETQAILPLLDGDLAGALRQCAEGRLTTTDIPVQAGAAVCVVMAAAGYPERPRSGDAITGLDAAQSAGALVFHAGTAMEDGRLVTHGGRVLAVVATGPSVPAARSTAYAATDQIACFGAQFRRDIALELHPAPNLRARQA